MQKVKGNWNKSLKIISVTDELKAMKRMAKSIIEFSANLPHDESNEAKEYALEIIQGVNDTLKDAKKMHKMQANPAMIQHLDKCISVAKKDRKKVEIYLHKVKRRGA